MQYLNIQNHRMKTYFETYEVSREDRNNLSTEETRDRIALAFRLIIWCLCAIFSLWGNLLGAILTTVFTVEAVWHIFKEAFSADKSRASALNCLFFPFAGLIMAYAMKGLGIIPGILIGLVIVGIPTALNWINRNGTTTERRG
ncbi:hypothetical protein IKG06_00765 [Candidatus Saccharibacteria bacterium]|nr:hypothetical protein [Candidatus Saccharibacteria bacterium]